MMFNFRFFRGGVHPEGHKQYTAETPITTLGIPERLYLPLRQHAGAAAEVIVKPGMQVKKGQLLATAAGSVSAPVHAPSSGTIEALGDIPVPHPSGLTAPGIVLACDGEDEWCELPEVEDPFTLAPEVLARKIAESGIVGLGGAVFPAAVKLDKSREKVDLLILNGSECEPYLTADDRVMQEYAGAVVDGARLIQYISGACNTIIGIEDNKPAAIAAMTEACNSHNDIHVKVVPARYPMGSAKQLIQAVTGREVPAGGRSSDIGVIMHNVATARAISMALRDGKPLISRIVTVAGGHIQNPGNVNALIGTPARFLIDACGGLTTEPERILIGGPMMGHIIHSLDVPVIKGASGMLALTRDEVGNTEIMECIRCGRCVSACPMGLMPNAMAQHSQNNDLDGAQDYGLGDCILCGSCSYVCPAHIPLVHHFQYAKGALSQRQNEQKKLDLTRQLSDAKAARQQQEAEAKAAAKAAKAAKRKSKSSHTEEGTA
ncbi:electron transport complex subunit RsxC [Gynuella sp.]|uniref:electron transport complex subunit RsxC n=1 Tax=Gynuella sp. TaxID=2969146 RepID=UPI003D149DCE